MAEKKSKEDFGSVIDFLNNIENKRRREDSFILTELMERVSGHKAKVWTTKMVGVGKYHYKYGPTSEGDSCIIGFSSARAHLTLYILDGFDKYRGLLEKLGKHKSSKVCMYINKLADVDMAVLEELIRQSVAHFHNKYGKCE